MRTRPLLAAVVTLLVALAACGSSNIIDGELRMYQLFDTEPIWIHSWPEMGGFECEDTDSDLAFNGDNTITGGATTDAVIPFGSADWWRVENDVTVTSGTWGSGPPEWVSGSLDIVATYWVVEGPEDCEPDSGPCTVEFDNVIFTGTADTATALPTLLPGDTITISGSNSDFETIVSGEDCGVLDALDDGRIELVDVVIEV